MQIFASTLVLATSILLMTIVVSATPAFLHEKRAPNADIVAPQRIVLGKRQDNPVGDLGDLGDSDGLGDLLGDLLDKRDNALIDIIADVQDDLDNLTVKVLSERDSFGADLRGSFDEDLLNVVPDDGTLLDD